MLTIFTIPKPFDGPIAVIQRNAIESWRRLEPACEILLCGDDAGVAETARELGLTHLPDIARNEYGTPLLDSAFARAASIARHPLLCYVNADIVLLPHFLEAVRRIRFRRFLLIGRRWNLDIAEPLDFAPGWDERLAAQAQAQGHLHPPTGIDYFVFPKDSGLCELPPFAVGRPGWDNWFVYRVRKLGIPVIDGTAAITVVHQNHGYQHVKANRGSAWEGPEGDRNRALMGHFDILFDISDATHCLKERGVTPALDKAHLQRRWTTMPVLHPWLKVTIRTVRRPAGWLKRRMLRLLGR